MSGSSERDAVIEEVARHLDEMYPTNGAPSMYVRALKNAAPQAAVPEGGLTAGADPSREPESDDCMEEQAPAHHAGSVDPHADPDAEDLPGRKDRDRGHGPAGAALVDALNCSLRSGLLFGVHEEPLDAYGKRIVRVIVDAIEREFASAIAAIPKDGLLVSEERVCHILAERFRPESEEFRKARKAALVILHEARRAVEGAKA